MRWIAFFAMLVMGLTGAFGVRAQDDAPKGWLGVHIVSVDAEAAEIFGLQQARGALVTAPATDGPAVRAGIRAGDVILSVNGQPITDANDLAERIGATPAGKIVVLILWREGQSKSIGVTLADRKTSLTARPVTVLPWGLTVDPLYPPQKAQYGIAEGREGLLVTRVDPGLPAAEAGLRVGDLITEMAQQEFDAPDYMAMLFTAYRHSGRDKILAKVENDDGSRFITLPILGGEDSLRWEDPADPGPPGNYYQLLADRFRLGEIVDRDDREALRLYRLAMDKQRPGAFNTYGYMIDNGLGIRKNASDSFRYYQKGASLGHSVAQSNLGIAYRHGNGTSSNDRLAVRWYYLAAMQDYPTAQANLGYMYLKGYGVPLNYARSLYWARRGAANGDETAQNNIGLHYEEGKGIPVNYRESYFWYALSNHSGRDKDTANRDRVAQYLPYGDRAAIDARVAAWKPGPMDEVAAIVGLPAPPQPVARSAPKATPQTPSKPAVPRLPDTALTLDFPKGPPRPDDIAVIIGNADYAKLAKGIPDVTPAYADAASMKAFVTTTLGIREGNVIDLRDATGSQMIRVFGSERNHKGQLFDWVKPNRSRVFVYYAGHGAPADDSGTPYLVPSDADSARLELNGYPLSTLYKNLSKIPAQSVTVVLEACFSGAAQSGSVISNASPVYLKAKTLTIPKGLTVIAAGTSEQLASWEEDKSNGLFTKYYLMGMSGAADRGRYGNGDGTVALEELKAYLDDNLTYYARRYYGRDQTAVIATGK